MHKPGQELNQLNKSGFPFQLRIEHEVRTTHAEHGWSVASREHPWLIRTSPEIASSGFMDIVLKHDHYVTFRLILECKRIKADDGRQLRWLFLLPRRDAKPTARATCMEVEIRGSDEEQGYEGEDLRIWDNVRLLPESLESEFCILPSDEQRKTPILETLASEVLASAEGLAQEEATIERSRRSSHQLRLFIFPAIVTNATLTVCRFDPSLVKIVDGTLDATDAVFETVPFIRFRKSMTAKFPEGSQRDLHAANRAREQTVFIVNASNIVPFLKGWEISPEGHAGYATQRYRE